MIEEIYKNTNTRMSKCIQIFQQQISQIRTGRASVAFLSNIKIEYYGSLTSICKLGSIIVENSRTIVITVFDYMLISLIEKAILNSNLGVNSSSIGNIIRVSFPVLTEERRHYLIKVLRTEVEHCKISIRNVRRDINCKIKEFVKNKSISEDEERRCQNKIQKLTDISIKKINNLSLIKEAELVSN